MVTGAASGIGLSIVRALVARGVGVAMADVDAARLKRAAAEFGDHALPVVLDVRDEAAWARVAEQAWAWRSGVEVLCNAAGVVFVGGFDALTTAQWRLMHAVNLDGPFFGAKAFLPRMLESGRPGRIVNVASLAGVWGETRLAGYAASKAGLVGFSEALQLELARTPVGVTLVLPGQTRTRLGASTRRLASGEGVGDPPDDDAPSAHGMDPDAVGARVVQALLADEVHVVTHTDWRPLLDARFAALSAAFTGPNADPHHREPADVVVRLAERMGSALKPGQR